MTWLDNIITMKGKYKLGITFGAFEHFHHGHVNLLKNAKKLCDRLIVCVSDDEYILKKKGHHPLLICKKRLIVVKAIRYVDGVDIQSLGFDKQAAVAKYHPDVVFVGDDWTPATFSGEGLGVSVIYLPYTKGVSSTWIREKLGNKK